MIKLEGANDFVLRFANVNGTGSASANNLFAKAIFRLGVPVSPKNIFPSNIQGLPTWYEVRINEKGYLGCRGGYDFIVAINGQTLKKDYEDLASGGYFLYDSTKKLPDNFLRDDITLIGIPLTQICKQEIENPKLRPLLKNIIYIGALAYLLDMEFSALTDSITRQFKKKPKLAEPNLMALTLGFEYAAKYFPDTCRLSVKSRGKLDGYILMDGNTAAALGAVYAGATVAGWYPITPSTSLIEAFDRFTSQYRLDESGKKMAAIIQAEDELAALGIALGASWNGARAFTATSGPGVSLMSEFLGLAYFAEIPVVLFNVQRAGPSTGMPTRTQQSDILACAYASHGDTKQVLLFPSTPRECFDFGAMSFDLAERLQTPIILMTDLDLGMNDNMSEPLVWDDDREYDRGKVMTGEQLESGEDFGRYLDVDGDAICYRTYPGTHPDRGAYFTRGTSRDEMAVYTERGEEYEKNMLRLMRKWDTIKDYVPAPEIVPCGKATDTGVIYFGTSEESSREALDNLAEEGVFLDAMRVRSFPFNDEVKRYIEEHEQVFVIEQNRDAQLRTLLMAEFEFGPDKLKSVLCFDGTPISARNIRKQIKAHLNGDNVTPLHRNIVASGAGDNQ